MRELDPSEYEIKFNKSLENFLSFFIFWLNVGYKFLLPRFGSQVISFLGISFSISFTIFLYKVKLSVLLEKQNYPNYLLMYDILYKYGI